MWNFEESILPKTPIWKSSVDGKRGQVENLEDADTFGKKKAKWRKKGGKSEKTVGDVLRNQGRRQFQARALIV